MEADPCVVGSRHWQALAGLWVEMSIPVIVGIHVKYYKGIRALENLGVAVTTFLPRNKKPGPTVPRRVPSAAPPHGPERGFLLPPRLAGGLSPALWGLSPPRAAAATLRVAPPGRTRLLGAQAKHGCGEHPVFYSRGPGETEPRSQPPPADSYSSF